MAATDADSCWTFKRSEMAFTEAANVERQTGALALLEMDPQLSKVARVHTREMVAAEALVHSTSQELKARITDWSTLGENIAVGQNPDALHDAFMASAVHRENILSADFKHVGVGVVQKDGRLWVTVIFEGVSDPGTTLPMPDC